MTWTSRGTRGFNQDKSEDLGQLQELVGIIMITNQTIGGLKLDGITTVRIWMIDRYDNTVFYDAFFHKNLKLYTDLRFEKFR